ncbi:RCC1 domain-containing protein [Deinococcus ruber]|uniref:RCC1-like domain-containing protein n=1 Tax=Deinococcus ruber TaxID=1848197 RepID=A0A918CD11_9DEIO|nr:hypothetical protein [Deinococcus ruber]GGR18131.1 hypothetical protein GCM10008957_33630 [Deinococcus ruber]
MNRAALTLLLPTLLLAACAQPAATVTPPSTATTNQTPSSGYTIHFQNVGASDFSASVESALQSQGLVIVNPDANSPANPAFTFQRISALTFVIGGTRYVQASFRVTNKTGVTLNSLKFVPVVPNGGSTPFSSVTYYDGSDASSKAASLTTGQATRLDTATQTVQTDAGASPYLTGLDVSNVDTSGLNVASVKNVGWQVASTFAPGASAYVTFAVSLPADANPKNDPFNFSLNVVAAQEGLSLTSEVQQYNPTTKTYGNYTQFPTIGNQSLPAFYDLKLLDRNGVSVSAVLCSNDGAAITNISSPSFPNRFRVTVKALGAHTLQMYSGTTCPAAAGRPLLSQPVTGVGPKVVPVAAGSLHSLAIKADGTVQSWGENSYGQLGNGTTTNSKVPVTVSGLTNVVAVAGGTYHSLALTSGGTVQSWGFNGLGDLGNGTTTDSTVPVTVSGLTKVVAVASGSVHSLALKADGTVQSWGDNSKGQLGNGTTTSSTVPVTVSGLTDVVAVASGGGNHSLALKADGTVLSWGENSSGQLGNGTTITSTVPVTVSGLTNVVAVASGAGHSLVLKTDGTVQSWGSNTGGQLGNGASPKADSSYPNSSVPVTVLNLSNVVAVASGGGNHSLALNADGTVQSWGLNTNGQLGNGTTNGPLGNFPVYGFAVPAPVSNLSNVVALAGGGSHSLALKADGTMQGWGYNFYGQLGNNSTTQSTVPTPVSISGVAQPTP